QQKMNAATSPQPQPTSWSTTTMRHSFQSCRKVENSDVIQYLRHASRDCLLWTIAIQKFQLPVKLEKSKVMTAISYKRSLILQLMLVAMQHLMKSHIPGPKLHKSKLSAATRLLKFRCVLHLRKSTYCLP